MRFLLLACCALLAATCHADAAEDRPSPLPTRDVDITYATEQDGVVLQQRSRFAVANQRLRLDTPTPGLYMIVDYRSHTMAVVSEGDQSVLDLPAPPEPGGAPGARYTRRNQDTVAGLACTEWETRDTQDQVSLACFTPDGVLLRARHGEKVLALATHVAYAPNDPALFIVPPGYHRTTGRKQ